MSFDRAIEEIIQAAMARGDFDNLRGQGKPQDHSDYFSMAEEDRLAFTVLKNAGYVPAEIELLKEIDVLRGQLDAAESEVARRYLTKQIDEKTLAFNLMQEQKQAARRAATALRKPEIADTLSLAVVRSSYRLRLDGTVPRVEQIG